MKFYIVVDGPNFISRLIDIGISAKLISEELSLNYLYNDEIKTALRKEFTTTTCVGIEYICSNKNPGPKGKKLTKEENDLLLERLSAESAVYINRINISSNNEKGVDIAVATRLIEVAEICDIICLIASDKDYIPVLEFLKRKGKYIITVNIGNKLPGELKNLSYFFIDLSEYYLTIFPDRRSKVHMVKR